ncbi:Endonuclease/exonuclease/phosphatase [Geranomyces variabilis]|nr:Endonuclease/exonuclease/phosphatase [Geranomyces variabilis]KAJ3143291.1 Sphingomyelin phosphodiesterase 2, neutral membrane (Neutral sphingomyelinase) [Geranomyces variabilis]
MASSTVPSDAHPLAPSSPAETTPLLSWDDAAELEAGGAGGSNSSLASSSNRRRGSASGCSSTRTHISSAWSTLPPRLRKTLIVLAIIFGSLFGLFALLATPWHEKRPPVWDGKSPLPTLPTADNGGARILAYNFYLRPPPIQYAVSADYKNERLALFTARAIDMFDIMAMSETFGTLTSRRARLVDAAAARGMPYWAHGPERNWWRGKFVDSGLLVMSRYPIVKTDTIEYVVGEGPDAWAAKGILYAQIAVADAKTRETSRVHLFLSHLQATYIKNEDGDDLYSEAATVRLQQFNLFRSFIARTLDSNGYNSTLDAVLMAGDFNVPGAPFGWEPETDSGEYLRMIKTLRQDNGTVVDVLREAEGQQTPTWHPWASAIGDEGDDREVPGKRLDYILQWHKDTPENPELKRTKLRLSVNETGLEPFKVEGQAFKQLSDHTGVTTVLRMHEDI